MSDACVQVTRKQKTSSSSVLCANPILRFKMNTSCLRLYARKHLSIHVQWWCENTIQARMNKGWVLTRSGFAIHAWINKGRKKTLRGVILTLVCYACVYVRKKLDSAFALASLLESLDMHVWKRLFKSSARSSSCHAKPARKNKLCTEPFLLRSTCSCEYVLTPANSTSTFLCTKNLRRVSVLHSENVKM